jgi:hypothetical protein
VRHCVTAVLLLFVWLAERIVTMAVEIEAYEEDKVSQICSRVSRRFLNSRPLHVGFFKLSIKFDFIHLCD